MPDGELITFFDLIVGRRSERSEIDSRLHLVYSGTSVTHWVQLVNKDKHKHIISKNISDIFEGGLFLTG